MNDSPFTVLSVKFLNSISLFNPYTDQNVDQCLSHWIKDTQNAPVAYAISDPISIGVKYIRMRRSDVGVNGIRLRDNYGAVYRPSSIIDDYLYFDLGCLGNNVGIFEYVFKWFILYDAGGVESEMFIEETRHTIYMTLGRPYECDEVKVYEPVVRWSCDWAAGKRTPKEICDALIKRLQYSGMSYGIEGGQGVRDILLRKSGMCGSWHRFFQQLVCVQGIQTIFRRQITLIQEDAGDKQKLWKAAVFVRGGINQLRPATMPTTYRVNDICFPVGDLAINILMITESYYEFSGHPEKEQQWRNATHAVNVLVDTDGKAYLYDPSFGIGPVPYPGNIDDPCEVITGRELKQFKADYFDEVFSYLVGDIMNGGVLCEGVLVKSSLVSPCDVKLYLWSNGAAVFPAMDN